MKSISEKPSESSVYLWNITASIANAGVVGAYFGYSD